MKIAITSFGFDKGDTPAADLVLDARFVAFDPAGRWALSGLDSEVASDVMSACEDFIGPWHDVLLALAAQERDELAIAIGCTAGQHRSVALAEDAAALLAEYDTTVEHRDIKVAGASREVGTMPKQFPRAAGAPWYEIREPRTVKAQAGAESVVVDLWIYDVIGDDWWAPSLTANNLCQQIAGIEADEIVLHMSSPGGSVSDGVAIYNALKSHPAKITARIEGWTCSIATVIALSAEQVTMFDNVFFMVHNPWGVAAGNAGVMRDYADFLDMVGEQMANIYMARCTKSRDELQAVLDAETYMTADVAAEWGFVDEIIPGVAAAASSRFDMVALGFHEPPAGDVLAAGKRNSAADAEVIQTCIDMLTGLLDDSGNGSSASATDPAPVGGPDSGDADHTIERTRLAAFIRGRVQH